MKKSLKIISILIILIATFTNISFAKFSYTNEMNQSYITTDTENGVTSTTKKVMGTILKVIRIVGMGIAVIMLTYVAIKYMSAAPSEKADFKKSAMAYIIGAIVLMGTTQIIAIIADFAEKNVK